MELLLHIGTEKTGSSFLQSLLANNRAFLESESVYFPRDRDVDSRMLKGRVSPGNAMALHNALEAGAFKQVRRLLEGWLSEGRKRQCDRLLLSNETLTAALQRKSASRNLFESAGAVGITSIRILLIVRDPVDQALSLYKHRAKYGTAPDVASWTRNSYDVDGQLFETLQNIKNECLSELTVIKYTSDGVELARGFFQQWLRIPVPAFEIDKRINVSLTLDEIEIIRALAQRDPDLPPVLYELFQGLPRESRPRNLELEEWHRAILSGKVIQASTTWRLISDELPAHVALTIPQTTKRIDSPPPDLRFSREQIEKVITLIGRSQNSRFIVGSEVAKKLARLSFPVRKRLRSLRDMFLK